MKFSQKISLILLVLAVATMSLLTVLMHFKFHTTNSKLISDRLNVTGQSITRILQNGLKLGIEISALTEIKTHVSNIIERDSNITDVAVYKISGDSLKPIFSGTNNAFNSALETQYLRGMRAAKELSFKGAVDKATGFVATTLKDAADVERALLIITYDNSKIRSTETDEVYSLYQRLLLGLLVVAIINFIAGHHNTRELVTALDVSEKAIHQVFEQPKSKIDLSRVADPVIRTELRDMVNTVAKAGASLSQIEQLNETAADEAQNSQASPAAIHEREIDNA